MNTPSKAAIITGGIFALAVVAIALASHSGSWSFTGGLLLFGVLSGLVIVWQYDAEARLIEKQFENAASKRVAVDSYSPHQPSTASREYPGIPGIIVGTITFVGCWLYAIASYGFLLGVGLGWLPSFFIGLIAAFLWPLIAIAGTILIGFMLFSG